jgi:hypothetical protein
MDIFNQSNDVKPTTKALYQLSLFSLFFFFFFFSSDMGSRAMEPHEPMTQQEETREASSRTRRVSTAHITPGNLVYGQEFAYDAFVSACADFLGSAVVNDAVTHFAENVLAVIGSPTTLDSIEVKRRLEQLLPSSHTFRHHRGMKISDDDCIRLCSLADGVVNSLETGSNLNIVDDSESQMSQNSVSNSSNGGDVHYIRQQPLINHQAKLPTQLPNFVEANADLDRDNIEYDMDVTPYDSDADDPPIRMVA